MKPWFAGRIDFSPAVKDLAADGFALSGGRLDLVGDRRIAAVVYKRRQHVINVFMWPASGLEMGGPKLAALKGYNALTWTAGGLTYWAVSDLNAAELESCKSSCSLGRLPAPALASNVLDHAWGLRGSGNRPPFIR